MRAGRLDRRITIQARQAGLDAYGQPADAWTTVATVWARLEPLSGAERFEADQRSQEQSVRFTVRFRAGIQPRQRVIFEGRQYDIRNVAETERRHELVLDCTVLEGESGVTP